MISLTARAASSLDASFNIGTGANGLVEQVLPLNNGTILICGNFTTFNGKDRAYIARLNSDGSVDESFHAYASYWVRNMAVQIDGKIVIGGYFTAVQGQPRNLVARLNADGSLDTSFYPGTGARDIIAGGVDGNNDPFVFWVAVQSDGKILITGNFRNYNGASSIGLARLNSDGSRDSSFNVGAGLDSWGRHLLIQPNGQILLAGWFTSYNNQSFNRLVRLNPNGSPDTSFNPYFGDKTAIYSTALVAGGKIIAAGHSLNEQGLFRRELERLNPDGSVDSSFVGYSNDKTESIVVQPDGKIILGGNFSQVDGVLRKSIARLNPDGTLDSAFQADIDNFVWGTALQSDGKLLISGGFYYVNGVSRNAVARLITGVTPGPPPPPVLSLSAISPTQINLYWSDSASTRTGYTIERKVGAGGTYSQSAAVGATATSYSSTGLTPNTQYHFRIKASDSSGPSVYSNEASATTPGVTSSSVVFVNADTTTHGTWKGVYGVDGYNVIGDAFAYPAYAHVTPASKSDWTWQWSTTDADALEKPAAADRIAACWYSATALSIDLNITDGQKHRVTLYFLDWDLAGRNQTVQISDGDTGSLYDTRTVSNFENGTYLRWDIMGHIKVTVTPNSGNAVVSGLFFDGLVTQQAVATPAVSPSGGTFTNAQTITLATATSGAEIRYTTDGLDPTTSSTLYANPFSLSSSATVKVKAFKTGMLPSATASASFTISSGPASARFVYLGADGTTQGTWRPGYGADGYNIIGNSASYPTYAQVSAVGKQDWTWNSATTDPRALMTASGSSRVAACWYSPTGFDLDLNFTDGATHRFAAYFCDWDYLGRSEQVELIDAASGGVLHQVTLSNFGAGQYLAWDIRGHVKIRITKLLGPNAVVSGIFLQPAGQQL